MEEKLLQINFLPTQLLEDTTTMNICLICLRTDRLLKVASNILKEFHDELCNYSVTTMAVSCYYCTECEYLLTKFYKFKEKCLKALKIYQCWMSTKTKKHPKNLLYALLPATSLSQWAFNPERIRSYIFDANDAKSDIEIVSLEEPVEEVAVNYEPSSDSCDTKFTDIVKIEHVSENAIKSEFDETKNDSENEEKLLENLNQPLENSEIQGSANLIVTIETKDSDKKVVLKSKKAIKKPIIKGKKKEKKLEKSLKRPGTLTATQKAYYDKFRENDKLYETAFDIEYLDTSEKKLEEFQKRKTYECYLEAKHKCEICYQVFKSLKFLNYHTNKWHNESPSRFLCPICKTWYSTKSNHERSHAAVYKCKLCPLITYHRASMQNHFEQHKGKRYHCELCGITYKSKSAYCTHLGKVHRRGRNVCEGCGRGFRSPIGLAIHKNNSTRCTVAKEPSHVPTATEGLRCDECDVTLPSQEVYELHIYDVHTSPRQQGRSSAAVSSTGLPAHTFTSGVRKLSKSQRRLPRHACRVCTKTGTTYGWLQRHFMKEHPKEDMDILYADKKKHLCDICGAGFCTVYSLRDHMSIHTGARPFACDLCPKQFRSAYLVRDHRLRHFPSTETCTLCGKKFKTSSNLFSHMKSHIGEKNHECDICSKRFMHANNLKRHVQGVHFNIRQVSGAQGVAASGAGSRAKRRKPAVEPDTDTDVGDSS